MTMFIPCKLCGLLILGSEMGHHRKINCTRVKSEMVDTTRESRYIPYGCGAILVGKYEPAWWAKLRTTLKLMDSFYNGE